MLGRCGRWCIRRLCITNRLLGEPTPQVPGSVRALLVRFTALELVAGQAVGTHFLPLEKVSKARKRWIAFSKKIKGKIYVDDGAKEGLAEVRHL